MAGTPLQIDDFSGGLTDFPVGANPKEMAKAKNIAITVDRKPGTRPGSLKEGADDTACLVPGPVNAMVVAFDETAPPLKLSNKTDSGRLYAFNGTTHAEIVGPVDSHHLFTSDHFNATDNRFIVASWNEHRYITSASFTQKPQKVYRDSGGTIRLRTAGLPKPAVSTLTYSLAGGANSRAYAIGHKFTYTSGNRTFIDRGPLMRFKSDGTANIYTGAEPTGGAPNVVGNFPVLSNGATDNYDTATIKIELYRTTNNGKIYYLVGEVTNATTSLSDGLTDAALILKETHYSTSGQPDFDPPPICKFMHVTERGIGLYAYIKDGSDEMKNRLVQSVAGDPDSVPGEFNSDTDEEITGVSSHKGVPIVFTTKKAYRGEGQFAATGSGALVLRKMVDSVGCISHTSIVQTPEGVFFAGDNGFYWTDGYTVKPISEKIRLTYAQAYASAGSGRAISGAYDELEKRVHWTFAETGTSDGIFVYHARFGPDQGGCFTIFGGEVSTNSAEPNVFPVTLPVTVSQNFKAKCLLSQNKRVYRGDERGFAFYFDPDTKTDPRVVTSVNCSAWGTTAISYDLRLVDLNFGTNFVRKWTPKVIITLKNRGDASLQVFSDRDLENRPKKCREFRKRSEAAWAAPGIVWGDPVLWASEAALYEEIRMLPVPGLRCSYRSLWFQNSFAVISKSDSLGLAALNATLKTLTLNTVGNIWPTDVLDLYLAFPDSQGIYSRKFLITARTSSTVLTFSDASNLTATNAATAWQLMGVAKGNVIEVQSLVLPYTLLDSTQGVFRPGQEGGNE